MPTQPPLPHVSEQDGEPHATAAHLARLRGRLSAYVNARPAPPDSAGLARQLALYAYRARRLGRLIATLHARSLPIDLDAAIDETLQMLEDDGFFDAFDNPAPPPPPVGNPPASADPENRGIHL